MRLRLLLVCVLLLCSACSANSGCATANCTRVLFIGNSYTYVNDLPATFAALARAGGHDVEVGMVAQGGWMLADHLKSQDSLNRIQAEKWTYVVLQEQSQVPAVESSRVNIMYPAARELAGKIAQVGATPVFYMTWGHRDGWPENGMAGYDAMQAQLQYGYLRIAQELRVPVAPVGEAWARAYAQDPQAPLWQDDGSHPTLAGTYLAACVFYAAFFRQSPAGLSAPSGISAETAQLLQKAAAETVLTDPQQWNLPAATP